jgi:SHS2 domain-containing protein
MIVSIVDRPAPANRHDYAYIEGDRDLGIVGYGGTLERAFERAAEAVFALMTDLSRVRPERTVPVSFIEADDADALTRWLALLIEAAHHHQLVFSEFHLQREHGRWWGCATGQRRYDASTREVSVKRAARGHAAVKRTATGWEVSCFVHCVPHARVVARSRTPVR